MGWGYLRLNNPTINVILIFKISRESLFGNRISKIPSRMCWGIAGWGVLVLYIIRCFMECKKEQGQREKE